VISTTFSSKLVSSSVDPVKFTSGDIVAFPNPSYGDVRFEFKNMPSDKYRVELYDILGRKMWSETSRRGQKVLDADLTAMRRGTYLYRVFDSKGKKLTTKRLMIVRP